MEFGVWGLGKFGIWGLGLGFKAEGLGFRPSEFGVRVLDSEFLGSRFSQDLGFGVCQGALCDDLELVARAEL